MLDKIFSSAGLPQPIQDVEADAQLEFERYDRIFRGSRGYAFLDWDLEDAVLHWRGGLLSYMGYDKDDIARDAKAESFLRYIHPDDRDSLSADILKLLKNEQHSGVIICRGLMADGSTIWLEYRLDAVRRKDGWVIHLSGLVSDVSALKAAEQALIVSEDRHERIILASSDGLWEWSVERGDKRMRHAPDGSLDWSRQAGGFTFNARCWEMIGFDADEEFISGGLTAWRSLIHPNDGTPFDKALVEHISLKTAFDIEYRIRSKDGSWCWIRARGQASYDAEGRPYTFSGTNMDISELKYAEDRVVRAKEEAETANQAKSEFLSSMSHELRTPLNAILGFTQLFELDPSLTPEQRENIVEIKSAGNHLLGLVGDVLDLAKIEAGHITLNLQETLPSRVIDECAALLKSEYEQRGITLELAFNQLEEQTMYVDATRLKQILLNLMANAGKYNKFAGSVRVECSLIEDARMKICVEDSGVGISENLQSQLFQSFNRLGAESSGVEGSGIGLVITKQLVEQMGGEIGFKSQENIGSQFWVEFPFSKTQPDKELKIEGAEGCELVGNVDVPELMFNQVKKILYVEDNPSNQKLMRRVLAQFPQIELTVVGLAVQGLYLARSTSPDLIILDVTLPGINGYEMVEVLKRDPITKDTPVIALSANVLTCDIDQGLQAGFDLYLTKPLDLSQLVLAFNEMIGEVAEFEA